MHHPLGEALNLVAEYTSTKSEAHNGGEADESVFALVVPSCSFDQMFSGLTACDRGTAGSSRWTN